ncbi:GPP34 family phosphoprotein [Sporichthya sp.]|uniref:GOLPH3/VPS74 family protein n=1 Tax=Sporichthya sp. TaxID=65475 RepID=UPI00181C6A85|nr:GPP34 family phosphoprotein [Sporichthya sp.]MBA3741448.1 GPP34 family phosphoprotein [Sporichthya sp.]
MHVPASSTALWIADDVALLLQDASTGRCVVSPQERRACLGAAVLLDLILGGSLRLAGTAMIPTGERGEGAADVRPAAHALVLGSLSRRALTPRRAIQMHGGRAARLVLERLVADGHLALRAGASSWFATERRWYPLHDRAARVRDRFGDALAAGQPADHATGALLAVVNGAGLVPVILGARSPASAQAACDVEEAVFRGSGLGPDVAAVRVALAAEIERATVGRLPIL